MQATAKSTSRIPAVTSRPMHIPSAKGKFPIDPYIHLAYFAAIYETDASNEDDFRRSSFWCKSKQTVLTFASKLDLAPGLETGTQML